LNQALWIIRTLLSHWRRHPGNLATLLVGLAIATALWSGVQALNQQARRSYDRASAEFGAGSMRSLVSARGALFSQDLYIKLRLAGWKVSPVLEGTVRFDGSAYQLIGIEPLTLPPQSLLGGVRSEGSLYAEILKRPSETIVSPDTLAKLRLVPGAKPVIDTGRELPPIKVFAGTPSDALIVDIGIAQELLDQPQRLSRLIVSAKSANDVAPLAAIAGDQLRIVEPDDDGDLARLTDSFHLNLTAFGLLAFLVGLFIVYASFGLAFEQRLPMVKTMRAVGVSARELVAAMLVELLLLALTAGTAGMIAGYLIASALLPDVAASLAGLYGAHV
jgi:putative ABC transport system permease protein